MNDISDVLSSLKKMQTVLDDIQYETSSTASNTSSLDYNTRNIETKLDRIIELLERISANQ